MAYFLFIFVLKNLTLATRSAVALLIKTNEQGRRPSVHILDRFHFFVKTSQHKLSIEALIPGDNAKKFNMEW